MQNHLVHHLISKKLRCLLCTIMQVSGAQCRSVVHNLALYCWGGAQRMSYKFRWTDGLTDATKHTISPALWSINTYTCLELSGELVSATITNNITFFGVFSFQKVFFNLLVYHRNNFLVGWIQLYPLLTILMKNLPFATWNADKMFGWHCNWK